MAAKYRLRYFTDLVQVRLCLYVAYLDFSSHNELVSKLSLIPLALCVVATVLVARREEAARQQQSSPHGADHKPGPGLPQELRGRPPGSWCLLVDTSWGDSLPPHQGQVRSIDTNDSITFVIHSFPVQTNFFHELPTNSSQHHIVKKVCV